MRLIDGDALKDYFVDLLKETDTGYGDTSRMVTVDIKFVIGAIKYAPTIEQKQGEWIYHEGKTIIRESGIDFIPSSYECSCCGFDEKTHFPDGFKLYNYCPNCGAKMKERYK